MFQRSVLVVGRATIVTIAAIALFAMVTAVVMVVVIMVVMIMGSISISIVTSFSVAIILQIRTLGVATMAFYFSYEYLKEGKYNLI